MTAYAPLGGVKGEEVPGQLIKVVPLPVHDISGRHDNVGLDFAQPGNDAIKEFITQHHAEVQV